MGMGFAPTRLRQVSPPASQNHFNHWSCQQDIWKVVYEFYRNQLPSWTFGICEWFEFIFSSRVSMRVTPKRDNAMTNPSVCLSITLWYCIETYAHIVKLSPPSGSGTTVVAWSATAVLKKSKEAVGEICDFRQTEIAVYLRNGTVQDRTVISLQNQRMADRRQTDRQICHSITALCVHRHADAR